MTLEEQKKIGARPDSPVLKRRPPLAYRASAAASTLPTVLAAKSAKPLTDEAGEKEEDKRAVSDLDKFDQMHRLDDDDD